MPLRQAIWQIVMLAGLCSSKDVCAQTVNSSNYYFGLEAALGPGSETFSATDAAYGIQFGVKFPRWYVGGSMGMGRIEVARSPVMISAVPGGSYSYTDGPDGAALLVGLHGGVFVGWGIGIGAVMIESVGQGRHYYLRADSTIAISSINWWKFDFGGDVHIATSEHYMINFAYSPKRGFNFGVDYVL